MARLSDSITYGNHAVTGDFTVNGQLVKLDVDNVGIGSDTPLGALHVNSGVSIFRNSISGSYAENIRLPESTNGYSVIHMGGPVAASGTGTNQWSILKTSSSSSHEFQIRHNSTVEFSISTSGVIAGNGSGLTNVDAETLDNINSTSFFRKDVSGQVVVTGGNSISFAANTPTSTRSSIGSTSNLHLDSPTGGSTYINYYGGTAGVKFGNGASTVVATMDSSGNLKKGTKDYLTLDGTSYSGTYPLLAFIDTNRAYSHGSVTFNGSSGTLTAPNFSGNGSGLTFVNADTLDGINSTSFLRSNANDTGSGWYKFTNSNGLETQYGIQGGYGDSNSSGSDWGANIWAMGNAYMGSGAGPGFTPGNYQLAWLRSGATGYDGSVGEGIYVFSQNAYRGGIGHAGMETTGALSVSGNATFGGNLYIPNVMYHAGDTNTYMQFHAADQWRVVTGGGERLEVNNTAVKVSNRLDIPDGTVGSNATRDVFISTAEPTSTDGSDGDVWYVYS